MSVAAIAMTMHAAVAETDALGDHSWFSDHPQRLFHGRAGDGGTWLIRRRRRMAVGMTGLGAHPLPPDHGRVP